jgi:hypothetical protein
MFTDYITNNLFLLQSGKQTQRRETATEVSLSDRSDTVIKTGSFPPTKVVHYGFKM